MDLDYALYDYFKLSSFRPGQKDIIIDLLNGNDVLAMLPTGSGKSLCYQLPALLNNGVTIVVSPLLSLMEDQVQQLKSQGHKRVVALNSFLTKEERKATFEQLHKQKLIYVSPEILQSNRVLQLLKQCKVSLFVVDEAHCISQWGHEFRTDYLKLAEVRSLLGNPPCLAITATATTEVQQDIVQLLKLTNYKKHIYSVDRPNIALIVKKSPASIDGKIDELVHLSKSLEGPGIIYASTRKWTEELVRTLKNNGINNVSYYHGGMNNDDRLLIQQQFINDELQLICCTSAFGMGINKSNIRFVIHFHFPLQLEAYLQEIGRAGRDGKNSIAITLFSEDEIALQMSLLTSEFPNEFELNAVLDFLKRKNEIELINETELIKETGITEVMWRFIRFQLEEQGTIVDGRYYQLKNALKVKQRILDKINSRTNYKKNKLIQFHDWLKSTNRCRRELVMDWFNEILHGHNGNCCDVCGVNVEEYYLRTPYILRSNFESWEKELKQILHQ